MKTLRHIFASRLFHQELSVVRAFVNFLSVFLTLLYFHHAHWHQATFVALITACWAAAMQFWNQEYLEWLSSSSWCSLRSSQKASLAQSYLKKFLSSSLYAAIVYLAMLATGLFYWHGVILALGRILSTSAESLFTQTAWQRNNYDWKSAAISRRPEKNILFENLSGMGSLIQSTIAVIANVLNVSGSPLGDLISFSVGTSGILLFLVTRPQSKVVIQSCVGAFSGFSRINHFTKKRLSFFGGALSVREIQKRFSLSDN